jgi:DNA-binding SARP family transcriptional activator
MSTPVAGHASAHSPTTQPIPAHIQTFGRFVCTQVHPIPHSHWRSQRTIDLFFVLITSPHYHQSRTTLSDMLWPDLAGDAALNNLRVALHRLRRVLDPIAPSMIVSDSTSIGLHIPSHVTVDCDLFHVALRRCRQLHDDKQALPLLRHALNLYQGEFMADQPVTEWNHQQRMYYANEYVAAAIRLGHMLLQRQLYSELIERMWVLLQHDHANPDAQQLLMLAYQHTSITPNTPPRLIYPTQQTSAPSRPLTP